MHAVHKCDLLLQMYSVVRDCLQGGPKTGFVSIILANLNRLKTFFKESSTEKMF